MEELQLNETKNISDDVYFSPASQQQIANERNTYHIYNPYAYNSNSTLNVARTTDNALGNSFTQGLADFLTDSC